MWETVRMAKKEWYLQFGNMDMQSGEPVSAVCNACDQTFIGKPKAGERMDDVLMRVRAEFQAHNCREDASQAAAPDRERSN
jgi:cytochrome c2